MAKAEFEKALLARAERLLGLGYSRLAVAQALDLHLHRVSRLKEIVQSRLLSQKDLATYAERCPGCGRRVLLPCLGCAAEEAKRNRRLLEAR